jgi:hypothetical protein
MHPARLSDLPIAPLRPLFVTKERLDGAALVFVRAVQTVTLVCANSKEDRVTSSARPHVAVNRTEVDREPRVDPVKPVSEPVIFNLWETFRPLLKYDPTKKDIQAVDIFHPSLADLDLKSMVTESISNIVHEGKGKYSCEVEFLEYFPPPAKSAVSSPAASKSTTGPKPGNEDDPATTRLQKRIAIEAAEAGDPFS